MKSAVLARIAAAQRQRQALVVVTRLGDGVQCLLDSGAIEGELSLSVEQLVEARSLLVSGRSTPLAGDEGLFARAYAVSYTHLTLPTNREV